MLRTYIYVDGFNLFYGAVKDTPYKWLKLMAMCRGLLKPHHDILVIKYFTAHVHSTQYDPQKQNRQEIYLKALNAYIPEIEIRYGHFLSNPKKLPLVHPKPPEYVAEVINTEEKGSDVNLALHFLNDAWLGNYDCGVIISNDSDFAEAVRLVRNYRNKIVGIINPQKNKNSKELSEHANFTRRIRASLLAASQLPDPIPGTNIFRPKVW